MTNFFKDENFSELLKDIESDRIERTTSISDTDKFCKAICAFSNDMPDYKKPGYLFIGANPKDGSVSGLEATDQLLRQMASYKTDGNIMPAPSLVVQKFRHPDGNGDVVAVKVWPSFYPPVRYKGVTHIRVGSRVGNATPEEERRLSEKRISHECTYDIRPCLGSNMDEISLDIFLSSYLPSAVSREVIAENNRDIELKLAGLRLYDLSKKCPTNLGIILLGKDPLRWIPGAYIQFVKFLGTSITSEVLDEKSFNGDLVSMLRILDMFVEQQIISKPVRDTVLKEKMEMDYPYEAIREMLLNAVMHRDYESNTPIRFYCFSDRIEISNPGGFCAPVNATNFHTQTAYRNPGIAEAMKYLGYVNRFGRGIAMAEEALRSNGNPIDNLITPQPNSILVTIKKK